MGREQVVEDALANVRDSVDQKRAVFVISVGGAPPSVVSQTLGSSMLGEHVLAAAHLVYESIRQHGVEIGEVMVSVRDFVDLMMQEDLSDEL